MVEMVECPHCHGDPDAGLLAAETGCCRACDGTGLVDTEAAWLADYVARAEAFAAGPAAWAKYMESLASRLPVRG